MNALEWFHIVGPVALAVLVPLFGLLFTPMGIPVLAWLIGSRVGRAFAILGAMIMLVWLIYRIGQTMGVKKVNAERQAKELSDMVVKTEVLKEMAKLSPDERRERLRKWAR